MATHRLAVLSAEQRNRAMRVARTLPDPTTLLVIDEADRLKMVGLEHAASLAACVETRQVGKMGQASNFRPRKPLETRVYLRRKFAACPIFSSQPTFNTGC